MSDPTRYSFSAHLAPGAGTAGLLRVVSILHTRRAAVAHLCVDADKAGGAVLTGTVTLCNAGARTLLESLRRSPDVVCADPVGDAASQRLVAAEVG